MKCHQLFKFYMHFYKEREKSLTQQSMRIEKLGKVGPWFIAGYIIKPFKIIIIFFFDRSFCSQDTYLFCKLVRSAILAL